MSGELFDWEDDLDMGEWDVWESEFWTTDWTILSLAMVSVACVLAVAYFVARAVWS